MYDLVALHEDPELIDKFIQDASRSIGHQFDLERLSELLAPLAKRNGFGKMDGKAFAADLLRRNSAAIQMRRAGCSLEDAVLKIYDPKQMGRIQEQVDVIQKAIMESGALEKHAETVKRLQDSVKDMRIPELGPMPGVEAALRSVSAMNAIQAGNWASLVAAAMPVGISDRPVKNDDK